MFERSRREAIISANALLQSHVLKAIGSGEGVRVILEGEFTRWLWWVLKSGSKLYWGLEWVSVALQRSALWSKSGNRTEIGEDGKLTIGSSSSERPLTQDSGYRLGD